MEIVVKPPLRREVDAVSVQLNADEQTMTLSDAKISVAGVNLPDFTAQALLAALPADPARAAARPDRYWDQCCGGRCASCGSSGKPDGLVLGRGTSVISAARSVWSRTCLRRTDSSSGPIPGGPIGSPTPQQ